MKNHKNEEPQSTNKDYKNIKQVVDNPQEENANNLYYKVK